MSEIDKESIETYVRSLSKEGIKYLCKQIKSIYLINEIGCRLLRFEKHSAEAKESLEKVV